MTTDNNRAEAPSASMTTSNEARAALSKEPEPGPAGWILVPEEPTEEMIEAGRAQTATWIDIKGSGLTVSREKMRRRYKGMVDAIRARPRPATAEAPAGKSFQSRVDPWMLACFGETIANDKIERNHRFLEESLELVQANGCTADQAHQLVDYVYGRPAGDPHQEVGGVMVTLAALCLASGLDMHEAAEAELARIWTKVDVIRAKQAAKPKRSPLPEPMTTSISPLPMDVRLAAADALAEGEGSARAVEAKRTAVIEAARGCLCDRHPQGADEELLFLALAELFPEDFAGKEACTCGEVDSCDECLPKAQVDAYLAELRAKYGATPSQSSLIAYRVACATDQRPGAPDPTKDPAEVYARRITIPYTNWRGEFGMREIAPIRIFYGSNKWHPEPQWLIEAWDISENGIRTFALAGIGYPPSAQSVTPAEPQGASAEPFWHKGRRTAANGCCSAIEPCSWQQKQPNSLCEVCSAAARLPAQRPRQDEPTTDTSTDTSTDSSAPAPDRAKGVWDAHPIGSRWRVERDGFVGTVVGHYLTKEGKRGAVLQPDGTNFVYVYHERWLTAVASGQGDGT